MSMHRLLLPILSLVFLAPVACQSPRTAVDRPAGFTIAATVYPPEDDASGTPPRALRPARYVVQTDAWLRMASGPMLQRPGAEYPALVRRLSPWQMDALWRMVHEEGLADPAHLGNVTGPPPAPEHPEFPTAVFEITRDFSPRIVVVVLDGQSAQSEGAARVLDLLADLGWVAE